jgi:peptidylprolyl isomerase|tara:strand:+ start:509 stop:1087 length:579 start_codon:yes stop_codon:yes gene_type:complete
MKKIILLAVLLLMIGCTNNNGGDVNMNPVAVWDTSLGEFKMELFVDKSPITAGNFKKLVEEGFYDGTRFHRVIKNFMNQGGDPNSKDLSLQDRWGTGDPGYKIEDEFIEGLSNVRGTISMANSGPNSGGSQFFINVVDNVNLDWDKPPEQSKHPVFGKVIEGMEVVDAINSVQTGQGDKPIEEVLIKKITIG